MQYGTVQFDDAMDEAEREAEELLDGLVMQVDGQDEAEAAIDRLDDEGGFVERVYFVVDE